MALIVQNGIELFAEREEYCNEVTAGGCKNKSDGGKKKNESHRSALNWTPNADFKELVSPSAPLEIHDAISI